MADLDQPHEAIAGGAPVPLAEHKRLVAELEIHQAELESQNAQLRDTQHLLEESRALYADLYDFAPVFYCTLSEAGNIEQVNLAGAAVLGKDREQLIDTPFALALEAGDRRRFREHLLASLPSPGAAPCALQLKLGGRSLRMLTSSFRAAGRSHYRVAMVDITEETRAEEVSRNALRMREDFLAIVSHDLRNPLNAIVIAADLLLRTSSPDERRKFGRRQLETIQRASERMNRLLADLLDLSSMDAGKLSMQPDAHDAAALIDSAIELSAPAAAARGVELRTGPAIAGELVYCDRERSLQVLLNLIGNAIKFTQAGGTVTVTVSVALKKREAIFTVQDTGIGLSPDQLEPIFAPYWKADRLSKRGTGLGLSISRAIALGQGGKLWVESTLGEGSTFFFTVPRYASPAAITEPNLPVGAPAASPQIPDAPPPPPPAVAAADPHAQTILIVDDEADARDALAELLRIEGYSVETAENGREALAAMKDKPPSLVLLDLVMPVMDGWQFLEVRQADAELSQVPVILISGQTTAQATAQSLGLAGAIEKPIRIAQLRQTIERSHVRPRPQA